MLSKAEKHVKKLERHQSRMRARLTAVLAELGIPAQEVDTPAGPVVAIGTGPSGIIGADRALGIVAAKMRQAMAQVPSHAPTRERAAKSPGQVFDVEVRPGSSVYGIQWPPDMIRRELTQSEHDAASALYHAHFTLHRSHGVGQYEGASSKGGGPKLPMTMRQQEAGAILHAMRKRVRDRMGPIYWDCATNFVLEIPMHPGASRPMTWVEFGKLCGNPGDDTAARWLARTMLKSVCASLAGALADYHEGLNRRASA